LDTEQILANIIAAVTRKFIELQSQSGHDAGFSDLSLRQIYYLETIQCMQNPTPTELAQAVQVSKPTVSITLDKLAKAGFIRKTRSDADKRSYHIHLSQIGDMFIQTHEGVHRTLAQTILQGLSPQDARSLTNLLEKSLAVQKKEPENE